MAQFNFRLFLRPTPVGKVLIDRLSEEGVDRQALSRRWIELGYALEQAGFRLDGTTLYQGANQLATGQLASVPVAVPAVPPAAPQPVAGVRSPHDSSASGAPSTLAAPQAAVITTAPAVDGVRSEPSASAPADAVTPTTVANPTPDYDEMTSNLRGLSAL